MVEVVELANNALLGRICKRLRKSAVSVLDGVLLAEFPQLTLFPRVSKTSETNLGYGLAILREHFFKHRFFEHDELVILTLMKGDEGVKSGEERTDGLLLSLRFRQGHHRVKEVIRRNIE